jgi:hypothetical protein
VFSGNAIKKQDDNKDSKITIFSNSKKRNVVIPTSFQVNYCIMAIATGAEYSELAANQSSVCDSVALSIAARLLT